MVGVRAPLIGLPGRRKTGGQIEGFPPSLHHLEIDIYLASYAQDVIDAGGLPLNLPLDVDPRRFIEHLDGLILTGGADIAPERYGQENTASEVDEQRVAIEFALLEGALDAEIPVLGICRGLQLINVHAGGTLHQDVPAHARYDVHPADRIHSTVFEHGSVLHDLYGDGISVNSLHHQTVDELGAGRRVTARDSDGTVEGIEFQGRDVVAVQWHPEMTEGVEPVFGWIIDRATARMKN